MCLCCSIDLVSICANKKNYNNDTKALSKIATNLLVNHHQTNLHTSEDDSTLANNFSIFFSDKIKHWRSSFIFGVETDATTLQFTGVKYCNFKPATTDDYDYDYEMVLLRHTISTMYHRIIFKSCKKHNILQ